MILVYILSAVILAVSLILQSHPSFDAIRFAGVKPDLSFIAIIYFSYSFGSFYGQTCAFITGIFQDANSNSPLGLMTLPKVLIAFFAGFVGRSVFQGSSFTIILIISVASLLKGGLTLIFALIFNDASVASLLHIVLPESVYNAVIAMPLFFIYDKIFEFELSKERY